MCKFVNDELNNSKNDKSYDFKNSQKLIIENNEPTKEDLLEIIKTLQQKMEKEIKTLRDELTITSSGTNNITNNINKGNIYNGNVTINNTNQTINMVGFGKEDLSKLSRNEIFKCLQAGYYYPTQMTLYVNFNKDFPENHNIQVNNVRDSNIRFYDGENWNTIRCEDFFDDLVVHRLDYVNKMKETNDIIYTKLKDCYKDALNNIDKLETNSEKYKEMKQHFRNKIIDKRNIVVNTQKKLISQK